MINEKIQPNPIVGAEVFTGMRPTAEPTLANYLGAVVPLLKLQEEGKKPVAFVADLHAITDHEPREVRKVTHAMVADYIALGLDPEHVQIFIQSELTPQLAELSIYLSRLVTVSDILRVPTLKEKLKPGAEEESARLFLAYYPVLMAADILLQRAHIIPVGRDQASHLEMTRRIARDFNSSTKKNVFPIPETQPYDAINIISLDGTGKMSKTKPKGAIFLNDSPDIVREKIKKAITALPGEMNEVLESHLLIAQTLSLTEEERDLIKQFKEDHLKGDKIMNDFKKLFTHIILRFLDEFQIRKQLVVNDKDYVPGILEDGKKQAKIQAEITIRSVREAIWGE